MKIRDSVFGSPKEREFYGILKSRWADKFNLYPSLPFASIIDIKDMGLTEGARSYLLKTSLDFTLCEKEADKPVLSIEFDGLGHGFSHDGKYIEFWPSKDPNRELKLSLKLRVAEKAGYPLIVVSFDETSPFSEDLELTIADGLIGRVLSRRRFEELINERRNELAGPGSEDFAWMKESYEKFSEREYTYDHYVQDWVVGLEVEAELESDPIAKQAAILEGKLVEEGIYAGKTITYLEEPPAPILKDFYDIETLKKRVQALKDPFTKIGCEVSFKIKGLPKEVSSKIFIRNFGLSSSLSLADNIATLLAAKKALVSWLSLSQSKNKLS